jgi:short subunit dehydrogenase
MSASQYPKPPFPAQTQAMPGATNKMDPRPDHGETSYKGSGKLQGKVAIITGGDTGIGRAVAIAFAREGADLLISYLDEEEDAQEVKALVEQGSGSIQKKSLMIMSATPARVWFGNVGTAASRFPTRSAAALTSELEICTRKTKRTLLKASRRR